MDDDVRKVKCVLIGDGSIGKTSLIVSYTTDGYPTEYVPTAFDDYSVRVNVDGQPVELQISDTAGQMDFDSLRPLCYPNTDVFLVCFSVVNPFSFQNVADKWIPELDDHCPDVPRLLVGTQTDLKNNISILIELDRYKQRPITEADAQRKAPQIGAFRYVECSSLTQHNMKNVFDCAIAAGLAYSAGDTKSMHPETFRKQTRGTLSRISTRLKMGGEDKRKRSGLGSGGESLSSGAANSGRSSGSEQRDAITVSAATLPRPGTNPTVRSRLGGAAGTLFSPRKKSKAAATPKQSKDDICIVPSAVQPPLTPELARLALAFEGYAEYDKLTAGSVAAARRKGGSAEREFNPFDRVASPGKVRKPPDRTPSQRKQSHLDQMHENLSPTDPVKCETNDFESLLPFDRFAPFHAALNNPYQSTPAITQSYRAPEKDPTFGGCPSPKLLAKKLSPFLDRKISRKKSSSDSNNSSPLVGRAKSRGLKLKDKPPEAKPDDEIKSGGGETPVPMLTSAHPLNPVMEISDTSSRLCGAAATDSPMTSPDASPHFDVFRARRNRAVRAQQQSMTSSAARATPLMSSASAGNSPLIGADAERTPKETSPLVWIRHEHHPQNLTRDTSEPPAPRRVVSPMNRRSRGAPIESPPHSPNRSGGWRKFCCAANV